MINIYRREVRAFSDKQIALLQNFAAQAVIAMENARLLTETREALEQQTATAEVLRVINSSPRDLGPVFDAMLEKALECCDAALGTLAVWDGENFHRVAGMGISPELMDTMEWREPAAPIAGSVWYRLVHGETAISIADLNEEEAARGSPVIQTLARIQGARSYVAVALRKENAFLGVIAIHRKEVRPFSDKQIALLQNFAAQAVIAQENARLISETREARERQTATAEILRVISSSPTDVQPTFEAIVARAAALCEAEFTAVARFDDADGLLHLVATNNLSSEEAAAFHSLFPRPPLRNFVMGRAFADGRPAQFDD